jgi:hypothetical protein
MLGSHVESVTVRCVYKSVYLGLILSDLRLELCETGVNYLSLRIGTAVDKHVL